MASANSSAPVRFGIIGGGWRAEAFVRIARLLPEEFELVGVVIRDAGKREAFAAKMLTPVLETVEQFIDLRPGFAIASVSWQSSPVILRQMFEANIPVLGETPPAPDDDGLEALSDLLMSGAKIQIAEQVALRPKHQAIKAAIESGLIGEVHQVQISVAHGYHGVSLLEELLGTEGDTPEIVARTVTDRVMRGPGRDGPPTTLSWSESGQTLAWLDYGEGKFGTFDFTGNQYFAWVRNSRILVRGTRGEIDLDGARWLMNFDQPMEASFRRWETGRGDDLSPVALQGITLGERWLYRSPWPTVALQDDEIAIATMMRAIGAGEEIYPLARAIHDHRISMAIDRATRR